MEVDMNFGDVNEKLACHISKVRMLWPSNQQPLACLMVSPEGTQDGDKGGAHCQARTAVTPRGAPEETQAEKTQDAGPGELRFIGKEWLQ